MQNLYYSTEEKKIAVVENNQLVEVISQDENIVGSIFLGRVENIMKGMDAAFVNIGLDKNAYLRGDDMLKSPLLEGQYIFVQVKQAPTNEKGVRVTCKIEFSGEYVVYMPFDDTIAPSKKIKKKKGEWVKLGKSWCEEGEGVLFRSSCEGTATDKVYREFQGFKELFSSFTKLKKKPSLIYNPHFSFENIATMKVDSIDALREWKSKLGEEKVSLYRGQESIFAHYLLDIEMDKGLKRIVPLQNGTFLVIEQLETMTVIDVNTGKYTGKGNMENTAVAVNTFAVSEIVRQLRLRNIGGMIFIDFINMKESENQRELIVFMEQELRKDSHRTKVYGFTKLGVLEMTRQRTGKSLREMMQKKCETCLGTGFVNLKKY